jgi:OmpA-OmpF porin, OOP family
VRALTFGLLLCCVVACGGPPPEASAPDAPSEMALAPVASADPSNPAEQSDATPPPADSDNDGVVDASDQCPDTRAGLEVDATGCPTDPDGDGVIGANDLCPDSPFGEPVDASGCRPRLAVAQEFTLLLTFEPNSMKIVGDPRSALAEVAALITQYPETTVVIEGHTDDRGAAKYNLKMSKQRADAVAKVLVQDLGIDAARVSTKGFGKTKPIATNATKEGRERNRRVVAVVLPGPAPGQPTENATAQSNVAP